MCVMWVKNKRVKIAGGACPFHLHVAAQVSAQALPRSQFQKGPMIHVC